MAIIRIKKKQTIPLICYNPDFDTYQRVKGSETA